MENLVFILWMIFFPFFQTSAQILKWKFGERKEYSEATEGVSALILIFIWLYVGSLLYVK